MLETGLTVTRPKASALCVQSLVALFAAAQDPDDLHQHDDNLVGGAINAGTSAIHQQLFFRPLPGLGRADTPIDRLYLAGASAHPGGAVHGGPGANAARAALARSGHGGAGYRRVINTLHDRIYR